MAPPSSGEMFSISPRLQKGVNHINSIEEGKFGLLVSKILQKIHIKNEKIFGAEEEVKLQSSLSLTKQELELVLETLSYILQQITYHIAKPDEVRKNLQNIKICETKREAIVNSWVSQAKNIVEKLRQTSVEPKQLESVHWRLNLTMGQGTQTRLKQPIAQLDLGIANELSEEYLFMEFNHEDLYKFYCQLEEIQEKLDSLR